MVLGMTMDWVLVRWTKNPTRNEIESGENHTRTHSWEKFHTYAHTYRVCITRCPNNIFLENRTEFWPLHNVHNFQIVTKKLCHMLIRGTNTTTRVRNYSSVKIV
jgi:hypothetical protein